MPAELDRIDRALLTALQGNARLTIAELADLVSLTTSPCWRRVKQLEESGYITGYQAVLSPRAMGFGVTAFVSIMMESHTKQTALAFEQQLMTQNTHLSLPFKKRQRSSMGLVKKQQPLY
ncbi:MAG TPA: hypothetical protein DIT96_02820 [Pseudomonas sp.]|nr:hypothetical protein [Pseudomonas sp.]